MKFESEDLKPLLRQVILYRVIGRKIHSTIPEFEIARFEKWSVESNAWNEAMDCARKNANEENETYIEQRTLWKVI